ncbi:MAG: hypothetical protein JHC95_08550 [Solirubrobacteraceae bacterium]|nr:hypothetical protein [Solirubrobacteraceae bacterium]
MQRVLIAIGAAFVLLAGAASPASAKLEELGAMEATVKGSCPDKECRAITRTTAYQAKVGEKRGLMTVPRDGRIVAFTLALGKPGPKQAEFFTQTFGGAAQAALVILRPGKKLNYTVVAKGPMTTLTDYFGQVAQFPLVNTLRVRKDDVVGITVPTWAPLLQLGLAGDTSWRSSQAKDACADTQTQSALLGSKNAAQFACLFRNQRVTYSATLISTP